MLVPAVAAPSPAGRGRGRGRAAQPLEPGLGPQAAGVQHAQAAPLEGQMHDDEDAEGMPTLVRAVGGGIGYTGASQLSVDLEVAIDENHLVARVLKRFARRTEGGEIIVAVATMGSLFLRLFQIGDGVAQLRVLDSNLTLEALSNAAAAVQAAGSTGPNINFGGLAFDEVVRRMMARTATSQYMFSVQDFVAGEPFPAATDAAIVKIWSQANHTTFGHLAPCRGGAASSSRDNRVLADAWGGFGPRGRAADRMPSSTAWIVLKELLGVFPASMVSVASNLANQVTAQCRLTVGPTCVDEVAADPETFLRNVALMRLIERGAVDAVAERLPLAMERLPNIALVLTGAEDPTGCTRRLIAAMGSPTGITADALVSLDVQLGSTFNDALTEPPGELSRASFAIALILKRNQALKALAKQTPSSAADPMAGARDAAEAAELLRSPTWRAMQADLGVEDNGAKRLQIILLSGSHLILNALATGKSKLTSEEFFVAASGKTIMPDFFQLIVSTDSTGATFSRLGMGARMMISTADLENLRSYHWTKVKWLQIGREYCIVNTPAARQYRFAATIGQQENFITLFFPVFKRIFRGFGLNPQIFDMLEGAMFDIIELSLPGSAMSGIIDTVWTQFLGAVESDMLHYLAQVSRFKVTPPGPAAEDATWRATVATFLSSGEAMLHFSHSGGLGAAAAAALTVAMPPPAARGPKTKAPAAAASSTGTNWKGVAAIEPQGAWTDKVEVSKDFKLVRISGSVWDAEALANDIMTHNPSFGTMVLQRDAKHMAFMFAKGVEAKRARFVAINCPARFMTLQPFSTFAASTYQTSKNFI